MKPTSHGALAENASSFSRLRRAGPLSCANGRALGRTSQVRASRRRRAARCPTPRRNVRDPLVDAPTQALRPSDEAAPDTESPVAATRHEPPDAPRSGKKLSRVHPARDALTLAAPRLSPPRSKIRAERRAPARPQPSHATRPTALPYNAALGLRQKQPCASPSRTCSARLAKRLSAPIRAAPSPRAEAFRPTGKEKRRDSLSLTKRWPEAEGDEQCGKCPPPRAAAVRHRRFPRASGTSSIGSRPQNARNVRREFHKPFREPFQRLAHPNGSAAPSRRADTGAQRLTHRASSKNIPAFKLENPSAAEAGDGNESTKEIPYLPSFLRRVRTVSDSSAPLPTQA